jgi:cell division protein FtsB
MSTLINAARAGARTRVPRFAEAAVERARLTVVPPRRSLGRTQAARTPFAVLVILMLAAGVVGLLMFNTNMQQASFKATALQDRVNVLTAREQSLNMELDELRDPQSLAVAARRLGMVAPSQPAFVRLSDGRVLGTPTPATPDGAVRINPLPAKLPDALKPKTIFVKPPKPTTLTTSPADTPAASTTGTRATGRNRANTQAESGATR